MLTAGEKALTPGREVPIAKTKVEDAAMWAVRALTA